MLGLHAVLPTPLDRLISSSETKGNFNFTFLIIPFIHFSHEGVNVALRKIGLLVSPEFTVEQIEGEHFLIKEWSTLKSHQWDFTLGQEFKDKTVDGREVMVRYL